MKHIKAIGLDLALAILFASLCLLGAFCLWPDGPIKRFLFGPVEQTPPPQVRVAPPASATPIFDSVGNITGYLILPR